MGLMSSQQVHIGIRLENKGEKQTCQQVLYVSGTGKTKQGQQIQKSFDRQDFCTQMKEYVDGLFDPTTAMSETDRQKFEQKIQQKIHSGEKLTADEMQYLRIHNPQLYAMMARVQTQREALKARLQSCRTKQEARDVYSSELAHIDKEDPAAQALFAAYSKVWQEVTNSEEYQALPENEEEKETWNYIKEDPKIVQED